VAVTLMILSVLAVLVLFGALVFYLLRIIKALESIGGRARRLQQPCQLLEQDCFRRTSHRAADRTPRT